MSFHDSWRTDWELERERRNLRDEWPYRSFQREEAAEKRMHDINREIRNREERREEEDREQERQARMAAERRAEECRQEEEYWEQCRQREEEKPLEEPENTPVEPDHNG